VGVRARGTGFVGATAHFLSSFTKRILSRNLDPSMLKNAYFLKKKSKNRFSVRGSAPPPNPRLLPAAGRRPSPVTLAYHYRFAEFDFSPKYVLLPSKCTK